MRRCLNRWTCLRALQKPIRTSGGRVSPPSYRNFAARSPKHPDDTSRRRQFASRYDVFKREDFPGLNDKRNLAAWLSLLERGLPLHLREDDVRDTNSGLGAVDLAEILLAAHWRFNHSEGIDLLYHLAIEKGRWRAVVWLVKQLVDKFAPGYSRLPRLSRSVSSWSFGRSLYEITNNAVNVQEYVPAASGTPVPSTESQTLENITDDLKPEKLSRENILRHDALGSIWRSLGAMSIACAGEEIRPEILEIIAYLHHMGIMPTSIYNPKSYTNLTAIQQPLMLNLFSSRILTSLSDAAWRAHENLIVEAAKAKGGEQTSLRPEIPGSAYRVYVAGLKPEVWLELILWSCLHGGWIIEGADILRVAYNTPGQGNGVPTWKPLSWRSLADDFEREEQDLHELESLFNAPNRSTKRGLQTQTTVSTQRTVSGEVVNAFVDALVSRIRMGVGERGIDPISVLRHLQGLHEFLARSSLSLGTGSWDAVVLRFYEAQDSIVDQKNHFNRLISLCPNMARELRSNNIHPVPTYVLDGSAAVLGLFHRALRSRIMASDVHGALRLFESLQTLVDTNKYNSVLDFLQKQRALATDETALENEMFTNNFAGIEYPAFNMQIPCTILGPFLELITDAKAYDFGKWLLSSDEIDGPVLSERDYGNPAITPALVRFAAETNDTVLLSKLIKARSLQAQAEVDEPNLPEHVLRSFFESQINLYRWDAAARILEYMRDRDYMSWNSISIAHVIRGMLLHVRGAANGEQDSIKSLARARTLLKDMVRGKFERRGERSQHVQDQTSLSLIILSTLDRTWADFSLNLQHLHGIYTFNLPVKAFNLLLDGVVNAYGSGAGRRLLGIFWSHAVREAQKVGRRVSGDQAGESVLQRFVPSVLDQPDRKRTVVYIPNRPEQEVIIYGGLEPDLMSIHTIFRKAIEELKQQRQSEVDSPSSALNPLPRDSETDTGAIDLSPFGILIWAIRSLRSMRLVDEDLKDDLKEALSDEEMGWIREQIPDLFDDINYVQETGGDLRIKE